MMGKIIFITLIIRIGIGNSSSHNGDDDDDDNYDV